MKFLLSVAVPAYFLDQATKWAILWVSRGSDEWSHTVIPDFFDLVHWQNTGAAFSIGKNNNGFFVILSVLTLIGFVIAWLKNAFVDKASRWAVALLVGGILGNVTDRLFHGHVVDFLLFDLHVPLANPWPAFNVADSCICAAAGLLLVTAIREGKKAKPN